MQEKKKAESKFKRESHFCFERSYRHGWRKKIVKTKNRQIGDFFDIFKWKLWALEQIRAKKDNRFEISVKSCFIWH